MTELWRITKVIKTAVTAWSSARAMLDDSQAVTKVFANAAPAQRSRAQSGDYTFPASDEKSIAMKFAFEDAVRALSGTLLEHTASMNKVLRTCKTFAGRHATIEHRPREVQEGFQYHDTALDNLIRADRDKIRLLDIIRQDQDARRERIAAPRTDMETALTAIGGRATIEDVNGEMAEAMRQVRDALKAQDTRHDLLVRSHQRVFN